MVVSVALQHVGMGLATRFWRSGFWHLDSGQGGLRFGMIMMSRMHGSSLRLIYDRTRV